MITQTQFTTVTNDLTELYNYLQENATEYFDSFTITEDKACIDCFIDGVKALEIFYYNGQLNYAQRAQYSSTTKGNFLVFSMYNNVGTITSSVSASSNGGILAGIDKAVKTKHGIFVRFAYIQNNSIHPWTTAMNSAYPTWLIISKTNYNKTGVIFTDLHGNVSGNIQHAIVSIVPSHQTASAIAYGNNTSYIVAKYYNSTSYMSVSGEMTVLVPIVCKRLNNVYEKEYFPHVFYTPMYQYGSYFVPVEIEGKKYIGNSAILLEDE